MVASMPDVQQVDATAMIAGARDGGMLKAAGWALAAWLVLLAVFAVNGRPLFYFDTAGYFDAGGKMLQVLGLFSPEAAGEAAGKAAGGVAGSAPDGSVTGSRSAVYSLVAATLMHLDALWALVMFQAAGLVLVLHLACRLVMAQAGRPERAWPATAAAALAGALGSAGFYTAYLMPDIFAPVLLLSIAGLAAFAPVLRRRTALALLAAGALAVVMHPSHLAIALMAVPGAALACAAFGNRGWWLSALLVALIAATGLLERKAFTVAVETATSEQVVYLPFFTARLIADGPGKAYLDATCPPVPVPVPGAAAPAMATCKLNALLGRPEQLFPERILFATDPGTGSFALLGPDEKRAIADEQATFLRAVVLGRPLDVAAAALRNTFRQMGLVSIDMTLPDAGITAAAHRIDPGFPDSLVPGRLARTATADADWVVALTRLHEVYYALTGLALLALLVLPQSRLPRRVRLFGVLVLLGILANAFVTGAISQPANRYGARVIFLVPVLLVMLAMARPGRGVRR